MIFLVLWVLKHKLFQNLEYAFCIKLILICHLAILKTQHKFKQIFISITVGLYEEGQSPMRLVLVLLRTNYWAVYSNRQIGWVRQMLSQHYHYHESAHSSNTWPFKTLLENYFFMTLKVWHANTLKRKTYNRQPS